IDIKAPAVVPDFYPVVMRYTSVEHDSFSYRHFYAHHYLLVAKLVFARNGESAWQQQGTVFEHRVKPDFLRCIPCGLRAAAATEFDGAYMIILVCTFHHFNAHRRKHQG